MAMEEEVTDALWEEMKIFAEEQQQCLYELLPECTEYKSDERQYLKQNIGYAIFGSPEERRIQMQQKDTTKDTDATKNKQNSCYYKTENPNDTDTVIDTVSYDKEAEEVINKIYDQICKCTIEIDDSGLIYFGTIYNMIFRPKTNVKPKKKEMKKEAEKETEIKEAKEDEKEAKKETKIKEAKEDEKEAEKETEIKKAKEDEKELLTVLPIAIFTIRKNIQKKIKATPSIPNASETQYETWYIDGNARVYKNWADYTENNNLPECTMVLPKGGFYQANPIYPCTEDYSTVWLEIMDSPACSWQRKLCNGIDIVSSVVGFGTLGLGVASMFTPLGPIVAISGLATAGATGAWSFGRNTQQLIDRSSHEESIHLLNKEAFPCYLGMAGIALGLGATGGSVFLSNAAARGMTINMFARVAFNTVQGGNLLLNGVGVVYQTYYMIDKYMNEKTVSVGDALNLATHLMFFCGSVVKVQFAGDIIESTQGKVMQDYKETLSNKRLRKKYNRIVRKAAENNTCKISENAEVIRYIRNRQELLCNEFVINGDSKNEVLDNTPRNIILSCEGGKLRVNGIILLDPIEYVTRLIKLGIFIEIDQNNSSGPWNCADNSMVDQLANVLCELLTKLYTSDDCPKSSKIPIVPDFEPLLREMSSRNINEDYLRKLFKITVKLMKRSRNMDEFLLQIFTFVWQYCKANLKQWGMSLRYCTQSVSGSKILQKIIIAVFEAIDMILCNLHNALVMYMDFYLHKSTL